MTSAAALQAASRRRAVMPRPRSSRFAKKQTTAQTLVPGA